MFFFESSIIMQQKKIVVAQKFELCKLSVMIMNILINFFFAFALHAKLHDSYES